MATLDMSGAKGAIAGDPAALRRAADDLEANADLNESIVEDIDRARASVLAGWSAPSAQGFDAFISQARSCAVALVEAGRAAAPPLREYADALEVAQQAYARADADARDAERDADRAENARAQREARADSEDAHRAMGSAVDAALAANERASAAIGALVGSVPAAPAAPQPSLSRVLNDYQVAEDEMVDWPRLPFSLVVTPELITRTEADLLATLWPHELRDLQRLRDHASAEGQLRYPEPNLDRQQDGHQDAFRHGYASALMVRRFGLEFARKLTTAHEGVRNPAQREAMDLYNNEIGRRIASENADAEAPELADRVRQALERGDLVIVDRDNALAFSDRVPLHGHGNVENEPPRAGGRPAEGVDSGDSASRIGR